MPEHTSPFPVMEASTSEANLSQPITFHHVDEFGKPLQLDDAEREASEQAIMGFQESLAVTLNELPNHTENLNIERINEFLEQRGIKLSTYHVITEEMLPQLGKTYRDKLNEHGLENLFDPRDFEADKNTKKGWHDVLSGQTFIVRRSMPEMENGPELTESIIVHELFHAASEHSDLVLAHNETGKVIKAGKARAGLMLPDHAIPFAKGRKAAGYFLEEAGASYFEGQYKKEFKPSKLMTAKDPSRKVGVPYEYAKFEGGKVVQQNGYGTAGYAMDLMVEARPELLDAIVESRQSAQGLRDVAQIINDIKPGLYGALSRLDPVLFHEENLSIIKDAIEGREDAGHAILRTEDNPEGHVESGFVSHGDRITHRAANSARAKSRLGAIARKAFQLSQP